MMRRVLGLVLVGILAAASFAQEARRTLADVAFLAGAWQGERGRLRFEEHWLAPAGGLMLGLSRTLAGDKAVAFEFLRLEERADGVFYVAQPGGRPPTAFKLTRAEAGLAVFENPEHDHPKVIRYRLGPEGSLVAQVEGDEKGRRVSEEFVFRRRP
jgi:hypothetical protein